MKELLEKGHPTHTSPSNGGDKGRGFWPPFSSKRPPLPLGEYIIAQVAKADKKNLPSNRVLQRIARLVKGHPLAMLEASLAVGGGIYGVYTGVQYLNESNADSNPSPSSRPIDSIPNNSFTDNRLVPRAEAETNKVNPEEVFDNAAEKGVISERNTVWMTPEEYKQIAPPVIARENRKEVPGEFNLPPDTAKATGRTTRKLTLEQGTSINAPIYVKTPEGKVRETTYTKISNPGKVTGRYPFPMVAPHCSEYLGLKGEIQAGDIFPAPISGRVYYYGDKVAYHKGEALEDGSIKGGYFIENEFYDEEGKLFRAIAHIRTSGITKPLIGGVPDRYDEAFKEKARGIDSSGKEVEVMVTNKYKIPVVMVEQGEDLFNFITKPPADYFSSTSSIKSQVNVSLVYHGDIEGNDTVNIFGGENCVHPTLDNKAVVLIQ